jgi:hypothetical protein
MALDKYEALQNKLIQPNAHSIGVLKLIDGYYPAFAIKILEKNPVLRALTEKNLCNMDILYYPICDHCETLALWSGYVLNPDNTIGKECTCKKCGMETTNPITLKDWILMELKKRAPQDIEESLVFAVDIVAQRCMADADRIYRNALVKENCNV